MGERPVSDEECPGYSDIIENPMSIDKIGKKVSKSSYGNCDRFRGDVDLIFTNCMSYHGEDSEFYKLAEQLRAAVPGILDDVFEVQVGEAARSQEEEGGEQKGNEDREEAADLASQGGEEEEEEEEEEETTVTSS